MRQSAFALKFGLMCLLALLIVLGAGVASAATIYVNDKCNLKYAIKSANQDRSREGCKRGDGHDTIVMQRDVRPDDELDTVDTEITIQGNGYVYRVTQDDPAFKVKRGGKLTINNLVISYQLTRETKTFEVINARLTLRDITARHCKMGVKQTNGRTTITGTWNICGLKDKDLVKGSGTVTIQHGGAPASAPSQPATAPSQPAGQPAAAPSQPACGGVSGVSGTQCRELDDAGVGNAQVINAGLMAAIDVWGYVPAGVEVCFAQTGAVMFLDATTTPRQVSTLESTLTDRGVCVKLPGPGSVALVHGQPTHDATAPPEPAEAAAPAVCTIETTGNLRLRSAPSLSGEVLGYVMRGSRLTRHARTTYWHQVTQYGVTGWLGNLYVREVSGCG